MNQEQVLQTLNEVAGIIRGKELQKKVFEGNKLVFEHNERMFGVHANDDDTIQVAKYTGLEINPPELIYTFKAPYNKTAFEIMIKHFNKLYP